MTVKESIVRGLEGLTVPQQIEIARHVYQLNRAAWEERAEILRRTRGSLSEADAQAFQEAIEDSRQIERHG